ncbi:MAG: glycosyltransferase family 2 protein [Candidatus Omnitrophica bacterium]|nr:glycosyltransferase family 2 protein [Candidatus Omnitrophota bacterium]
MNKDHSVNILIGAMEYYKIAVLITCHNRKEKTLVCLESLYNQKRDQNINLQIYLVDDGSTDGTSDVIKEKYPEVIILFGSGNLFWGGGMRLVFAKAMEKGYDFYLWLNDDVILYQDAVTNLIKTYFLVKNKTNKDSLIVGACKDPFSGKLSYSGKKNKSVFLPLSFKNIEPRKEPVICNTISGNCVLIPDIIAKEVGNIDKAFPQKLGDMDYGLRARKKGYITWLSPWYAGKCSANPATESWADKRISLRERVSLVPSLTRGKPIEGFKIFAKRYGGPFWFIFWLLPYRKIFLSF